MAKFFQDILKQGATAGIGRPNTKKAIAWYRKEAQKVSTVNPTSVMGEAGPFQRLEKVTLNSIGRMYMFQYDAKWKEELPYWDMFPLIFVIGFWKGEGKDAAGFMGINLHYLDPRLRAVLMDSLWDSVINKDKLNKTTKVNNMTWETLQKIANHSLVKPCVKKYLFSHVRSLFMNISPEEWNIALMLPMQRFQKASDQQVWADSRNYYNQKKAGV